MTPPPTTPLLAFDLILLGFPNETIRPGTIVFTKPNAKLLEEILYFLLNLLDPLKSTERLQDCWPVSNAILAKRFRVEVLKWWEELRKTGSIPRECALRKSYLDENFGERLEECLGRLAEFLVEREGEKLNSTSSSSSKLCIPPETLTSPNTFACEAFLLDSNWNKLRDLERRLKVLQTANHLEDHILQGSSGRLA